VRSKYQIKQESSQYGSGPHAHLLSPFYWLNTEVEYAEGEMKCDSNHASHAFAQ